MNTVGIILLLITVIATIVMTMLDVYYLKEVYNQSLREEVVEYVSRLDEDKDDRLDVINETLVILLGIIELYSDSLIYLDIKDKTYKENIIENIVDNVKLKKDKSSIAVLEGMADTIDMANDIKRNVYSMSEELRHNLRKKLFFVSRHRVFEEICKVCYVWDVLKKVDEPKIYVETNFKMKKRVRLSSGILRAMSEYIGRTVEV